MKRSSSSKLNLGHRSKLSIQALVADNGFPLFSGLESSIVNDSSYRKSSVDSERSVTVGTFQQIILAFISDINSTMSQAIGNVRRIHCLFVFVNLTPCFQTALAYARVWHHVDATDRVLGKLAERIALVLMGKHKPIYDPSGMFLFVASCEALLTGALVDCGDYVIVTNSRKVKVTGRKDEQLLYRKHTMYPGGLKETPYKDMKLRKPDEASPAPADLWLLC